MSISRNVNVFKYIKSHLNLYRGTRICKAEVLKYVESRSYYSNITTSISKYVELWHNVKFPPIIISVAVNRLPRQELLAPSLA